LNSIDQGTKTGNSGEPWAVTFALQANAAALTTGRSAMNCSTLAGVGTLMNAHQP
jgi:hypothetical protein